MLFRLPYSWLNEYVAVPKDPHKLARQLSLYGPSVERVVPVRHEFTKVVVGQIVAIRPHPNAGKLQIANVKVGSKAQYEIVCGAPNIKVGQKVPLALAGAVLPGGVTVSRREVRGVASEGMLCSARELGIHDDHLGIHVLHPATLLGKRLSDLGAATDFLLEVEPTTNRPDVSSVIGVAREVSAITGKKMRRQPVLRLSLRGRALVKVVVKEKRLCRRFVAAYVSGVQVGPSPWVVQERLARAGIRPINNIVDITNYVMLELGQPMHAFDADKLGPELIVRLARSGEKLKALDGRTYTLKPNQLVIANSKQPVGLAGIMGGEETGVTSVTTNVIFEAASWDPVQVRRTSRELELMSEASRLFEKGLSTEAPTAALARALTLAQAWCGGKPQGRAVDVRAQSYRPRRVRLPLRELERTLGCSIPLSTVVSSLGRLGFSVSQQRSVVMATVPFWRDHDVSAAEDLVEEVARLYGYHRFQSELPPTINTRAVSKLEFEREDALKHELKAIGFTEIYSSSLVPERFIESLDLKENHILRVANPLTQDLVCLRPSLLPSLVAIIAANQAHHETAQLFEIASVYGSTRRSGRGEDTYRQEKLRLTGVIVAADSPDNLFRRVRGVVEHILPAGIGLDEQSSKLPPGFADGLAVRWSHPSGDQGAGGLLDPRFTRRLGVSGHVAAFDLPLQWIIKRAARRCYKPLPKFPAVKRDIALVVSRAVRYTDFVAAMRARAPLLREVTLFDIYHGSQVEEGRVSYALHLTFRSDERTLTAEEVSAALESVMTALRNEFNVTIRS